MGEDWISTSSQQEKNVAETAASHLESIHQDDGLHGTDLRIDGDDADHDHETPVCFVRHEESAFPLIPTQQILAYRFTMYR